MDSALKSKILELGSIKLPKNLSKYVLTVGRQRSDFLNAKEWAHHAEMYRAMRLLQGHENFTVLAIRIIEFIDRHPSLNPASSAKKNSPLTRKERQERKRRRVLSSAQKDSALASRLRNAKPTVSASLETWRSSPRIGLGIESTLPPTQKARRDQVKIDKHTQARASTHSPHILYVAGWTLTDETD